MSSLLILISLIFIVQISLIAQNYKPEATIEHIQIDYKDKKVKARKLTVSTKIPMSIENAWQHVKTPNLLKLVTKGRIKFVADDFPEVWQEGDTASAKMYFFGFFPFGGRHYLFIKRIDNIEKKIETEEWDNAVKVWNHTVFLEKVDEHHIIYTDEIIIYAKWKTGFVTQFAKSFYKHRQRRWLMLAEGEIQLE